MSLARLLCIVVLVASAARAAHAEDDVPWTEFELGGTLIDDRDRLTRMFAAELAQRPVLSTQAKNDLTAFAAELGYKLVDTAQGPTKSGGVKITLMLDPIVMVRWVEITLNQGVFGGLGDDELRRRLRVRVGSTLPWEPGERQALLNEDKERLRRFLRDEGFFEARVDIKSEKVGRYASRVKVVATLGPAYRRGRITVINASSGGADLAIPPAEVAGSFSRGRCDILGRCRFTYARFLTDLDEVTAMFQRRGYPSVRVTHDFDPLVSFDRRTKTVDVQVSVDPRRKLDVVFEGNDKSSFPDDALTKQLTFAGSGTADDVEVEASARSLERYYQSRGYFDVAITSERVRLGAFDRVVYRIEPGAVRRVRGVRIACTRPGGPIEPTESECTLSRDELDGVVSTEVAEGGLLRRTGYTNSSQLSADAASLTRYYRARGFEHARVRVDLAPTPAGWVAAAVSVAQVLSQERPGDLHVRFAVDEGPRTVIERMHVVFEGRAAGAGNANDERRILERVGIKPGDPYVRDQLDAAAKDIADWYWQFGRPRARVTVLEPVPGSTANGVAVTFNIEERQEVKIGEVVVRGNFRTRDWVVRDELGIDSGELLTGQLFTAGPQRLRSTNLFDAVKLDFVGLDDSRRDVVNVVAYVEERHDVWLRSDVELGASTENGVIARLKPALPNLWGVGMRLDATVTCGTDIDQIFARNFCDQYEAYEGTLRVPRWISRKAPGEFAFDTDLTAFHREQETERFGELVTRGASIAFSRTWERPLTEEHEGRLITAAVRYDVRRRSREEELVRPPGLAGDLTTNPIVTRTGAVGVEVGLDQRRDERGNLNPLAPAKGFRIEGGASWADQIFYGQDSFLKLNGLGQVFFTFGRLQLRVDGRYDHGIPLDGAVLLPEVERYFAGGDSTVRGFEEDRLATEIIQSPVPPLGQTTQIRVLPAGGNIRALSTVDAQVTVWKIGSFPIASAVFVDAGLITNTWATVDVDDIRPSAGSALRCLLPIGAVSLEYAIPIFPRIGDNPRGRVHFAIALRY